ncbi:type IV pilus twitching motility protein PilT [Photobacterium leiognathi]|uniref:type IV pilus twitching motility protein PilT n=1 Tax=Photobacterium leiognathi TaxID=553611 RepID=UPI0029813852|nr:PilT/PilU family type 4a pilus ATPase [Photobacterium leiognathi]
MELKSGRVYDLILEGVNNGYVDIHITSNMGVSATKPSGLYHLDLEPIDLSSIVNELSPSDKEFLYSTGDIDLSFKVDEFRARGCLYLSQSNYKLTIRILPNTCRNFEEIDTIGTGTLRELTKLEKGLVLITGPTGSGKTTTLNALINHINNTTGKHIITIEDPIEFSHKDIKCRITQREYRVDFHDFEQALLSALRQGPDIILVGELRTKEAISLALSAAETGHLVLATLHTSDVTSAITRLVDSFPANEQSQIRTMLSMSLRGVVCQKLIFDKRRNKSTPILEIGLKCAQLSSAIKDGRTHQIKQILQTNRRLGMISFADYLKEAVQKSLIDRDVINVIDIE